MENHPAGESQVFALDIGTRSIIGIVGRPEGDLFHIEACERIEHPMRAMIDGQIEDIDKVAKMAGTVKTRLEEKLGHPLKKVAVAAAGRALKTCRATAKVALGGNHVTAQMVYELEHSAVNEAREKFRTGDENARYYCVGHSVVRYTIDDYPFTSILDHRGEEAAVEIIATFLPSEVVGSLRRCMEMVGLEIDALTLEPIAAMRAVLPMDIRLLNLALVDIGAGTADIALTRDGAVSGYTMATVAGDEITEAIIRKFLVDFNTAEKIKIAVSKGGSITCNDILGHEHTLEAEDVLSAIDISVEMLAKVIADRTLETNEGPPVAVFLVGGGAHTPGLPPLLSDKIGLDEDKVAIAGSNFAGRVLTESSEVEGPEYATPVGIALVASDYLASGAATITINNSRVRLFGEQTTSVMDALLVGGYSYSDLMGRNGRSLTFTFNGERKVLRGGQYTVADIKLNGKSAGLTTPVESGDIIDIEPATSGEDATATIAHYSNGMSAFAVSLNGHSVGAGLVAYLNGSPAAPEDAIHELDDVEIHIIDTVGKLCQSLSYSLTAVSLTVNGLPATPNIQLNEGDDVQTTNKDGTQPEVSAPPQPKTNPDAAPAEEALPTSSLEAVVAPPILDTPLALTQETQRSTSVSAQPQVPLHPEPVPEPIEYMSIPEQKREQILQMAAEAEEEASQEPTLPAARPVPDIPVDYEPKPHPHRSTLKLELNGHTLVLPPKPGGNNESHTLIDLLPLVDIDPANPEGKLVLEINNVEAGYLEELNAGDRVTIAWGK